jgi:ammonium transporter, Amt family
VVLAFSFAVSLLLGWLIHRFWGFRISAADEVSGIDASVHAETAYDLASLGGSTLPHRGGQAHAEARLPG